MLAGFQVVDDDMEPQRSYIQPVAKLEFEIRAQAAGAMLVGKVRCVAGGCLLLALVRQL